MRCSPPIWPTAKGFHDGKHPGYLAQVYWSICNFELSCQDSVFMSFSIMIGLKRQVFMDITVVASLPKSTSHASPRS